MVRPSKRLAPALVAELGAFPTTTMAAQHEPIQRLADSPWVHVTGHPCWHGHCGPAPIRCPHPGERLPVLILIMAALNCPAQVLGDDNILLDGCEGSGRFCSAPRGDRFRVVPAARAGAARSYAPRHGKFVGQSQMSRMSHRGDVPIVSQNRTAGMPARPLKAARSRPRSRHCHAVP
jgi:hypothetical protein